MIARLLVLVSFPALFLSSALASQVLWGSARLATNYLSEGAPQTLDEGFTFQLGSFSEGFSPSAENTASWLARSNPGNCPSKACPITKVGIDKSTVPDTYQ